MAEAAVAVNEGTRVTRKNDFWPEMCKREWFKNLQRPFLENNIFQSWLTVKFGAGCECSSDSDLAARSLSLEYRKGKTYVSLPDDLTVKDYFYQWVIFMIIFMTLARRQAKDEIEAKVRRCLLCFSDVYVSCWLAFVFFPFQCWLSKKNLFSLKGRRRRLQGTSEIRGLERCRSSATDLNLACER